MARVLQIFDLKGSMRNRHIQETGKANEVLLDENLVESEFARHLSYRKRFRRPDAMHRRTLLLCSSRFSRLPIAVVHSGAFETPAPSSSLERQPVLVRHER